MQKILCTTVSTQQSIKSDLLGLRCPPNVLRFDGLVKIFSARISKPQFEDKLPFLWFPKYCFISNLIFLWVNPMHNFGTTIFCLKGLRAAHAHWLDQFLFSSYKCLQMSTLPLYSFCCGYTKVLARFTKILYLPLN